MSTKPKKIFTVLVLLMAVFASPIYASPSFTSAIINTVPNENGSQGIAWIDYDNDGDQDLIAPRSSGQSKLFRNDNGSFIDVTGGVLGSTGSRGAIVGDYDGDGFDDIFMLGNGNKLLKNMDGNGTFEDVTVPANLSNEVKRTMSAAFGDIDQDGDLDLYVANWLTEANACSVGLQAEVERNDLYINNGNGTFTRNNNLGPSEYGCTWATTMSDYDSDGDLDIITVNDVFNIYNLIAPPSEIYKNELVETGTLSFTPIGFGVRIAGMGIAVGDYDNDLDLDYVQTDIGAGHLSTNLGFSTFNTTRLPDPNGNGWGTVFFDANNDGFVDLYTAMAVSPFGGAAINSFLLNNAGTFTSFPGAGLNAPGGSFGVAVADYDNDGDVDVVTHSQDGTVNLYTNTTSNSLHWLKFRLVDNDPTKKNHRGIGARIITDMPGTFLPSYMREVSAGSGLGSSHDLTVHFGIGSNTSINSIEVIWPNYCSTPGDRNFTVDNTVISSVDTTYTLSPPACAPVINSFDYFGDPGNPGDYIRIKGANLDGATNLRFNGVASTDIGVVREGKVVFGLVPTAMNGPILIDTPTVQDMYVGDYILPELAIDGWAATGVGLLTTITGSNFIPVSSIKINGASFGTYQVGSPTSIGVLQAADSIHEVTITKTDGTSVTKDAYPTIASVAPGAFPNFTDVTGTNFEFGGVNVVTGIQVNGSPFGTYQINGNQITLLLPLSSISQLIVFTVHGSACWGSGCT